MDMETGCRVTYGVSGKMGVVRYVGEVDSLSGEWVGIELDKPEGKHNGELNGKVYFTCPPNHGVFVKKAQVKLLSTRSGASPASTTTRFGGTSTTTASGAGSASRLQQMRDRRASGIGLSGSTTMSDRRATMGLPSSSSSLRGASTTTPSAVSPGSRPGSVSGTPGVLRRTPSSSLGSSAGSTASSRMSVDGSARRLSMSRAAHPPPASDELVEARARVSKLEEELEDRNRHVEQLKQNLVALRESHERADIGEPTQADENEEQRTTPMEVDDSGTSDEAAWLEKIESIRQEAEEHVRSVRAELEEHIGQLQAEHEELLDELKLENATQSAEIKSLEAEVAQHKARISQFTTGEQKKAEEVALAMAKTSAGARKVEGLETQLNELNEMIETLTLEKETLEMDKEIAEERVEELIAEVEKLKTSVALASATSQNSDQGVGGSSLEVAEENLKLRAAVKALHDRSSEEKNELNKKVRQLQRENAELHSLREEVEKLAAKKNILDAAVEELKEQLDVASAYESMVEELTEKNLTLGDRAAELEASVATLESLKEMSDEVEHQQNEYVTELTAKIESQQARLQELKNHLAEQKTVIEDKDRTIARFRDLTNRSRDEISQLKAQLRAETGELESLKGTTHSALNQTMTLRALAASARENEAEAAKQRINADQARLENAFLRAAIPSSIFSEMDQKVLRVRLRLGRISGKADILLQYLRKDLDGVVQRDPKDDAAVTVVDSERAIQQLLLGEKLAALTCEAKEDLFVLECHQTTSEDYIAACDRLDSLQVGSLEAALDGALTAFADGSLFASPAGEASMSSRLQSSVDEWVSSHSKTSTNDSADGFPMLCAVVKLRSKQSVLRLSFSFAEMMTFVRTIKSVVMSPDTTLSPEAKQVLANLLDKLNEEYVALIRLAQHLYRRADIDLASSDDDLDGSMAVGGDVVELVHAYANECQELWSVVQEQLSFAKLQTTSPEDIASFAENSLLAVLLSLKERLASLFKSVCRGAFIDAVSSRTRDRIDLDNDNDGRPQWQIRAQTIQKELLNASSLQASLKEMNDLSQVLHTRVRELERSDSQHRVVTQKLESETMRLNDNLNQAMTEKTRVEEQLVKEREQFTVAIDESHKVKATLDSANRELRKQLKRTSDIGVSSASSSSRNKSALSQGDTDAFRKAFNYLHGELHRMRATLAKERVDSMLGPVHPRAAELAAAHAIPSSERLVSCAKEVVQFGREVKSQLSMPRMVDLTNRTTNGRDQLVQKKLEIAKRAHTLADLRTRISTTMQEDGWGGDFVNAISRGENVFGWRPPEMERPPVLLSRLTLLPLRGNPATIVMDQEMEDVNAAPAPPVQLILNHSQVNTLKRTLMC